MYTWLWTFAGFVLIWTLGIGVGQLLPLSLRPRWMRGRSPEPGAPSYDSLRDAGVDRHPQLRDRDAA